VREILDWWSVVSEADVAPFERLLWRAVKVGTLKADMPLDAPTSIELTSDPAAVLSGAIKQRFDAMRWTPMAHWHHLTIHRSAFGKWYGNRHPMLSAWWPPENSDDDEETPPKKVVPRGAALKLIQQKWAALSAEASRFKRDDWDAWCRDQGIERNMGRELVKKVVPDADRQSGPQPKTKRGKN